MYQPKEPFFQTDLHAAYKKSGLNSYANPVHPGDFPDPSVVRVGESQFYAVTTSTEWAPLFPVFASTDLVSWTRCGSVFSDPPQWAAGQFWAPEITYRDGVFFVYYTARKRNGPLTIALATATDPRGPWHDKGPLVGQSRGSIDATTASENGKPWLIWKEDGNASGNPTTIWAQPLSDDGRTLTESPAALMRNDAEWEDRVVEAPGIIEREGWFYLLYSGNSSCGEKTRYAIGAARARLLAGPWEKCPHNPIVASNEHFRGPGHGSVTTTSDGRTWYLYHAYRNAPGSTRVGRELMLDAIDWNADGWPSVNGGKGPSSYAARPFAAASAGARRTAYIADFTSPLDDTWQWPHSNGLRARSDIENASLTLEIERARRAGRDPLASVVAQPARSLNYTAVATLASAGLHERVMASLAAVGDQANALGVGVRDGVVYSWRRRNRRMSERAIGMVGTDAVIHLRLDAIWGQAYRVSFSLDGSGWSNHADILDGTYLPRWDRGVRVALTAGGKAGAGARWTSFRLQEISPQ